jgi:Domain of unknown function (DUF3127)
MSMEFIGKILTITKKEAIGAQGLEKQSVVLEESNDKQYKDSIMMDFFGEKCGLIAELGVGDVVKMYFNPRAKEYNARWYNSINGWKVEVIQKGNGASSAAPVAGGYDDNEDLPF